jgi:hypothetical protein
MKYKECINCLAEYQARSERSKYCSTKCAATHRSKNPEYIAKLSESGKKADRPNLTEDHKMKISESLKSGYAEGKIKISDETRKKMGVKRKGVKINWKKSPGVRWTEERKRKWSVDNKGGRCEWYEVERPDGKKIKVQGFWEYQFALLLNIIDPNWIKPTIWNREHQFNWIDSKGDSHWYTPDFWSPLLNKYFEIKGFWIKNQHEKKEFILSLSNVDVIDRNQMEKLGLKIKK